MLSLHVVGTPSSIDILAHKVGTVCCRFEDKDGQRVLYLMTMGILAVSNVHTSAL